MDLSGYIDHTNLKPDCTAAEIKRLCEEAIAHRFFAVCVPPYFVKDARNYLKGHPVKVATVTGFPMGYSTTSAKVEEIKRAADEGADEIDVVVNISAVKNGNWNYVRNDIDSMTTAAHLKARQIKIIFETGLLTDEEIRRLCEICREVEPEFVKTSTGFNGPGASLKAVRLMRKILDGTPVKIKASGGIRTRNQAEKMIDAGAQRIGTSSGIKIVTDV